MSTAVLANRRRYDAALKLHAAQLVRDQHLSVRQVCEDLNIDDNSLYCWVKQYDAEHSGQPGQGLPLTAEHPRPGIREPSTAPGRYPAKKGISGLNPGIGVIQTLIHRWQEKADMKTETAHVCRLLGVSRSGVYAARTRQEKIGAPCATTTALHRTFADSGRCYGSRRLSAALKAQGHNVGRYRTRRLMRQHALRACWKRLSSTPPTATTTCPWPRTC